MRMILVAAALLASAAAQAQDIDLHRFDVPSPDARQRAVDDQIAAQRQQLQQQRLQVEDQQRQLDRLRIEQEQQFGLPGSRLQPR